MKIIPAIDLLNGKCVRLVRGEERSAVVYDKDPLVLANEYMERGARRIHVIDLDGAFTGTMKNMEIIRELAARFPLQVGGGIRTEKTLGELLEAGVQKVILSTLLLRDKDAATDIKRRYDDRIIGSFDFSNGALKYAGWTKESASQLADVVRGLSEIIVTDIERDGTLTGPNIRLLESIKRRTDAVIIAAGGIRDVWDLYDLKRIGMGGAIIGKAFLENRLAPDESFRFEQFGGE